MREYAICKKYVDSLTYEQLKDELKEHPFLVKYLNSYNLYEIIDINIETVHFLYDKLGYGDIKKIISTYEDQIFLTLDNNVNVFNTLKNVMLRWENIDEQYDFFFTFLPHTKFNKKSYVFELYGYNGDEKQIFLSKNQILEISENHALYIDESKLIDCITFYCKEDETFIYKLIKNQALLNNSYYELIDLVELDYNQLIKLIRELLTISGYTENIDPLVHKCIKMKDLQIFNDIKFLNIKEYVLFIYTYYLNSNKKISLEYPEFVQKVYDEIVIIETNEYSRKLKKSFVFPLKFLLKNKWKELWIK